MHQTYFQSSVPSWTLDKIDRLSSLTIIGTMKFETIPWLLLATCLLSVQGQSSSSWSSYNSQKDVHRPAVAPVDNSIVELQNKEGKDLVSITESPKNGAQQSMYYYEMFPSTHSQGSQGRYRQKNNAFYPAYEAAGSNQISQYQPYRKESFGGGNNGGGNDNHQNHDSGGWGAQSGYTNDGSGYDSGSGWSAQNDEGGKGGEGGGLSGLAGLIGLLGLKGLVPSLKGLLPLLLALPLLPILLPILLFILFLPLLPLILFLPIPVVVTPGARNLGMREWADKAYRATKLIPEMAAEVLQAEECVEKFSCEIARVSRMVHAQDWVAKVTSALPKENKYTKRILEGAKPKVKVESARKTSEGREECAVYSCQARSIIAKHLTKL